MSLDLIISLQLLDDMKFDCTCLNSNGILTCKNNTIENFSRDVMNNCRYEIHKEKVKVIDLQNQPMLKLGTISFKPFMPYEPDVIWPKNKQSCQYVEGVRLC